MAFNLLGVKFELRSTTFRVAAGADKAGILALAASELARLRGNQARLEADDAACRADAIAGLPREEDRTTKRLKREERRFRRDLESARTELLRLQEVARVAAQAEKERRLRDLMMPSHLGDEDPTTPVAPRPAAAATWSEPVMRPPHQQVDFGPARPETSREQDVEAHARMDRVLFDTVAKMNTAAASHGGNRRERKARERRIMKEAMNAMKKAAAPA
jgi:hypothetical protein